MSDSYARWRDEKTLVPPADWHIGAHFTGFSARFRSCTLRYSIVEAVGFLEFSAKARHE